MSLPGALNPQAIAYCAILVRKAVDDSRFADMSEDEKGAVVARGVEKMMQAGAYVEHGRLFLPADVTALDL